MKNLKSIAIALLVTVSTIAVAQTKKVDATKSKITWLAKKVTGQHSGTVNLKEGSLVFKKAKLTGGSFVVDMFTIQVTDLKAGEGKEKLEGHLNSEDFFGTDKFKTANLTFKTVKATKVAGTYSVTADLTIKEITSPVTFDIAVKGKTANAKVVINRTKYGIKYGSGSFFDNLGDKVINDNFDLNVTLQF
ncbi:MAG: YceI family protein [Flavobacterium sp.]|nr:YceI family protein [Flavobacterium sp.]